MRGDDGTGDLAAALKAHESTASFFAEKKVQTTATKALARTSELLQVSIGETSASVEAVSETVVNLNGKVSAQTNVLSWQYSYNTNGWGTFSANFRIYYGYY